MIMKKIIRFTLLFSVVVALSACKARSPLTLSKTASPTTYTQIGHTILYTYVITNTGNATLGPSQFTIADNSLVEPFNCGPADNTLAANSSITCTAAYTITQADINAASLTNSATASGAGLPASQPVTVTITNLTPP